MLNLIFVFIGGGLFLGGQFTSELKLCNSIISKGLGVVSDVIGGIGEIDVDPKIGMFSFEIGNIDIGGLLKVFGSKFDANDFGLLPLPKSAEEWTFIHALQYGGILVDALILISLISSLVQLKSQSRIVTAVFCVLTGIGAGVVVVFAHKVELPACPNQKAGYSFYMLVGSAASFIISSIVSCCA